MWRWNVRVRAAIEVLSRRVRDERGTTLVIALGTMTALTIAMASVISMASASSRHADRSNAGQRALALAEAGVNNAIAVLHANYPGTVAFPGDPNLLPARTTSVADGSVTWSGTLTGPLTGVAWRYEWRITATGSVPNPSGPGTVVARTTSVAVPVTIPTATVIPGSNVLNWIYAGTDAQFDQSVQIGSPVYTVRDLFLSNTSKIRGSAGKLVVGRNLYLAAPLNRVGLISGLTPADPRIGEAHIVSQCSSKTNPTLHSCVGDADEVYATVRDNVIPASLIASPKLTCCAPYAGTIAPADTGGSSSMGFWYQYADLGPTSPCDPATKTGTPPTFESVGNIAIDNSATPVTQVNLTPTTSYTCKSTPGGAVNGELSWNASTKVLTIKGTIFIDGSIAIETAGAVASYSGQASIIATGTFNMKNSKICAIVSGSDCNTTASAWDPNTKALVIVADGDGGNGGAQSQTGEVPAGEGIHLKGASFQGALIANKSVTIDTTSSMQGPLISVYNKVTVGQTGVLTFPAVHFAPSGGASITGGGAKGELLVPQNFGS